MISCPSQRTEISACTCSVWRNLGWLAWNCLPGLTNLDSNFFNLHDWFLGRKLSNCRKLLILGCCFMWCKLFILFIFVYDKNKDTPLWIGSIATNVGWCVLQVIPVTRFRALQTFSFSEETFVRFLFQHDFNILQAIIGREGRRKRGKEKRKEWLERRRKEGRRKGLNRRKKASKRWQI